MIFSFVSPFPSGLLDISCFILYANKRLQRGFNNNAEYKEKRNQEQTEDKQETVSLHRKVRKIKCKGTTLFWKVKQAKKGGISPGYP